MQMPISQAFADLGLMPNPAGQMDEQKRKRQKEQGTAADDSPGQNGDRAYSQAVVDLFGGMR